jgi:hypothetical protein
MGRPLGSKDQKREIPNPEDPLTIAANAATDKILRPHVEIADPRLLLPRYLVAKAFGVSIDTLSKWDIKAVIQRGREALYYLPEVINVRHGGDGNKLNPGQEKAQLDRIRRESAELDLARKRAELVSVEEVRNELEREYVVLRQRFLALPTKLARALVPMDNPQEISAFILDEVGKILEGLKTDAAIEIAQVEKLAQAETENRPEGHPAGVLEDEGDGTETAAEDEPS